MLGYQFLIRCLYWLFLSDITAYYRMLFLFLAIHRRFSTKFADCSETTRFHALLMRPAAHYHLWLACIPLGIVRVSNILLQAFKTY